MCLCLTLPPLVSAGCAARVLRLARWSAWDTVDGLISNFTVCYGRLPHWCVGTVQCVSVWTQVYGPLEAKGSSHQYVVPCPSVLSCPLVLF